MTTPLVRLGIRVRREQAELALAALLPILRDGAEETEPGQDEVEYAVYAPRAELPKLDDVRALAGDALIDVTMTEVPPGWERRWHQYLQPVEVAGSGRRVRIRPPWQPAAGDSDVTEVVIDPGELFGAGTHPTTRLCLELLLELDPAGALADWGSGSGVLAIAAARLGYAPVLAVDVEPASLEASKDNAEVNGVELEVRRVNLRREPAPWAPTVTANLVRPLLLDVARLLERVPERLIASGLLREEADEVAAAFSAHGLRERDRRCGGEWAAVLLAR